MAALSLPTAAWAEDDSQKEESVEEFDVFNDGDFLIVPVRLDGKTYSFVVDTGCMTTFVDVSLVSGTPLGEKEITGAGGRGTTKVKFYPAPMLQIGKIAWRSHEPVAAGDLTQLRQLSGHDVYGLLGMDFLRRYAVHIDFDRGKLRLLRSPAKIAGRTMPIFFADRKMTRPCVVADLPGWGPEQFLIDTGDVGEANLRQELFHALAREGVVKGLTRAKTFTFAGIGKCYSGVVHKFGLAGTLHPEMALGESHFPQSDLGLFFWRRYNLVFDFPEHTMTIRESHWFDDHFPYDFSGMRFRRRDGRTVIDEVEKGSPAALLGLKRGDVLVRVAGMDAAGSRFRSISGVLAQRGDKIEIQYRRGAQQKETVMLLESWKQKRPRPSFLKEEPSNKVRVSLLVGRASSHALKKEMNAAFADYDQALRLDPSCVAALVRRARAWEDSRDYSKSIADLDRAVQLQPKDTDLYFRLARVHFLTGNLQETLDSYEAISRLEPDNAVAHCEASRVHATKENWKRALAEINEAIRLDPKDMDERAD
jgi:hypothetical protein